MQDCLPADFIIRIRGGSIVRRFITLLRASSLRSGQGDNTVYNTTAGLLGLGRLVGLLIRDPWSKFGVQPVSPDRLCV